MKDSEDSWADSGDRQRESRQRVVTPVIQAVCDRQRVETEGVVR